MRILHILDHSIPLHSGYTFRTLAILKEQRLQGWETHHLTSPKQGPTESDKETINGLTFYRTNTSSSGAAKVPLLKQFLLIAKLAKRLEEVALNIKPDVLHAHSPALNAIAALKVGQRLGIPVVYEVRAFWEDAAVDHGTSTEWGIRYRMTRALETYAMRKADAVTTICEGLRKDIVGRGIDAEKVTVIPNAVDIGKFVFDCAADENLRKKLNLKNKRVIGFIGSFYAYEGLSLLLHAASAILAEAPETCILLVGGGEQEAHLRQLANELKLGDNVIFTGRVPHDQVELYYSIIDVLVYPRLSMRLTELVTPLKPLEAMAQGRLLVASDVGGHRELIADGKTGILFQAGSPSSLAEKLVGLLNQQEVWNVMRQAGRAYVETERNWPNSVRRYTPIYERISRARLT